MSSPSSFEQAMEKLESIVKTLESESTSLDDSLALFEEGVRLSRFCSEKLDEAERKIQVLLEKPGEDLATEPIETVPESAGA